MSQSESKFHIRTATPADAVAVAAIYAPYVLDSAVTFDETPPSTGEIAQRIRTTLARDPFLIAEIEGVVVGYAYASPRGTRASFRWSIDVAIYIAGDHCRRGVGRALYQSLLPILTAQGYARAYGVITLPNTASSRLHESFGFRHVATLPAVGYKLGAWRDVGWWELQLMRPLPAKPAEPVAFPHLPPGIWA